MCADPLHLASLARSCVWALLFAPCVRSPRAITVHAVPSKSTAHVFVEILSCLTRRVSTRPSTFPRLRTASCAETILLARVSAAQTAGLHPQRLQAVAAGAGAAQHPGCREEERCGIPAEGGLSVGHASQVQERARLPLRAGVQEQALMQSIHIPPRSGPVLSQEPGPPGFGGAPVH